MALYLQNEMVFMKIQQTLIPHFPKLQRKSAALHREVIRKLLSGKGNIEFIFSEPLCLCGKIGHQLCARCALPHVGQLFAEAEVFLCKLAKQISDDMTMMRAGFMFKYSTVTAVSATTLTFSTEPGAQA